MLVKRRESILLLFTVLSLVKKGDEALAAIYEWTVPLAFKITEFLLGELNSMIDLHATPLSHFSRKVRILLDLYGLPYRLKDVGSVAGISLESFADNPLMKIPTYVDGDDWLIDSDHIAGYIVRKNDPTDRYEVQTVDNKNLNVRAVLNGVMQEEVKVILAARTGVPIENYKFFDKSKVAMAQGLKWLEEKSEIFRPNKPTYREFHLICLWEHLQYYDLIPSEYPNLKLIVDSVGADPVVRKSSPLLLKKKIT